jgi:vitamin K-dependent gamma-carboxylase
MARRLFQPVDIASLVFFRIAFGILGFADIMGTWIYYHLMTDAFNPEKFQLKYYGFEWATPFREPFMSIFFLLLAGLCVLIIIGKWYRVATALFAFGFTYTFLLEKANYLNHGYVFCWICFVMIFLPANRQWSGDVLKNPALKREQVPYWCLFILQFVMGVVYFYGGLAKINPDWLNAIPLKQWIAYKKDKPVIGPLLDEPLVAYFMAYGGLMLDLTAPFFLMFRKTRPWAFLFVLFFHFVNTLIFAIGIFPSLSICLSALYFSPDFPRRWIAFLSQRYSWVSNKVERWRQVTKTTIQAPLWQAQYRQAILAVLVVVISFHLLVPFRHHLYPGDVTWTEEGHRYSWRMMLRSKRGFGYFIVKDIHTGKKEKVNPRERLSRKQARKVLTHPDMILLYAHHLRDEYEAEGKEVEIYADIKVSLNYRDYCLYVDPAVNLAEEEWHFFKSSEWVLPEKR